METYRPFNSSKLNRYDETSLLRQTEFVCDLGLAGSDGQFAEDTMEGFVIRRGKQVLPDLG
jgi:hypothetical protein